MPCFVLLCKGGKAERRGICHLAEPLKDIKKGLEIVLCQTCIHWIQRSACARFAPSCSSEKAGQGSSNSDLCIPQHLPINSEFTCSTNWHQVLELEFPSPLIPQANLLNCCIKILLPHPVQLILYGSFTVHTGSCMDPLQSRWSCMVGFLESHLSSWPEHQTGCHRPNESKVQCWPLQIFSMCSFPLLGLSWNCYYDSIGVR